MGWRAPRDRLRPNESLVVADHRPSGGRLLENPEFLHFAAHWGFRIRACRPYRARTKGKVERPTGYLRSDFRYGRTFLGDADLADQGTRWLTEVANARVHGTTGRVPQHVSDEEERAHLRPLAARAYQSLLRPAAPVLTARPRRAPVSVERRARSWGGCQQLRGDDSPKRDGLARV